MHKHNHIFKNNTNKHIIYIFLTKFEKLNPVEQDTEAILAVSSNLTSSN